MAQVQQLPRRRLVEILSQMTVRSEEARSALVKILSGDEDEEDDSEDNEEDAYD